MLALMRSTFKTSFLVYLSVVVGLITLVIGVLLNNMLGFAR
jgi:hypothetical protein